MLMRPEAEFDLAVRLREGSATVAEIYAFISGCIFAAKRLMQMRSARHPKAFPRRW